MNRLIQKGLETIDYSKVLNIGGLLDFTLRKDNTVATKYKYYRYVSGSEILVEDYTRPEDKSRRWYGEVYIPASTKVIAVGDYAKNKVKVTNDTNVEKDGYLLLVFDTIETTVNSGAKYLKYDEIRDPDWNAPNSPSYNASSNTSTLVKEKNGKGSTYSASSINSIYLPNGTPIKGLTINSDFYKTDAPIIIYDVSLRANNDYEETGTH